MFEYRAPFYAALRNGALYSNMTVGEAILRIRRTGIDKETIYTCYVTRDHKLVGLVSVKDLLLCEDDATAIESIMIQTTCAVPADPGTPYCK